MIDWFLEWLRAHRYTSTACQHGKHDDCRKTCKFCGTWCRCKCHVPLVGDLRGTPRLDPGVVYVGPAESGELPPAA